MSSVAYDALTANDGRVGVLKLPTGFVRAMGRDRAQFLQGQISNDVLTAAPGQTLAACLLNSTGHLLAYLRLHISSDYILIETNKERIPFVLKTLNRYIVRERVELEEAAISLITVQGCGSNNILKDALSVELLAAASTPRFTTVRTDFGDITVIEKQRFTAAAGFDVIVDSKIADTLFATLIRQSGVVEIDNNTSHVLRIESGEPSWGADLDETIIPLEAGLESAISYSKGCYVGQEIIARIHSRGHTNRKFVGLKLDALTDAGSPLKAIDGDKQGQDVGRITSVALSPRFGPIGLGYVRNEYSAIGAALSSNVGIAAVSALPFTDGQ